jgi:hypothetical protein
MARDDSEPRHAPKHRPGTGPHVGLSRREQAGCEGDHAVLPALDGDAERCAPRVARRAAAVSRPGSDRNTRAGGDAAVTVDAKIRTGLQRLARRKSPTQRTLAEMRKRGYQLVAVTERWNAFAHIRQDLFGIVDVLCIRDQEICAVQTTSYSNVPARVNKITEHASTPILRKAGVRLLVHGWRKHGGHWVCREVDVS